MTRAPQKRRLETRAKLLDVAAAIVQEQGYSGLRVEDVVARAGVAKGTLFSHFKDKDGLLAVLIGDQVMRLLDDMAAAPPPDTLEALIARLEPLLEYIAADRVIFDLLLRYSGSTGAETNAVVTQGIHRQIDIWAGWIAPLQAAGRLRAGPPPELLAEGIQAFLYQVLAVWFCSGSPQQDSPRAALTPFLQAWLLT